MKKLTLVATIILYASMAFGNEQKLTFKENGKEKAAFSAMHIGHNFKSESLETFEPHEGKKVSFRGYSLQPLLDKAFGEKWKSAELIVFHCLDGYKSVVPRVKIQDAKVLLAIERLDQKNFQAKNKAKEEAIVELGPYYLVWDNLKNELAKSEGSTHWAYQVVGIELTSLKTSYPKIIPPEGSDTHVRGGFQAFQKYCLGCHKVNGQGGERGPDLALVDPKGQNYIKWLRKWIDSPRSIKPKTLMPPMNKDLMNRDMVIDDIINYLMVMRKQP